MRVVGTTAVYEQIKREGARMGLFPLLVNGTVYVAEYATEAVSHGEVASTRRKLMPIANIDLQHPLRNLAYHRKRRHEVDRFQRFLDREEKIKSERLRHYDDMDRTYTADLQRASRQLGGTAILELLSGGLRGK